MEQKKQNKSNRVYPDQILQRQLERRTAAALKQHEAFALEHREDSREELLAYVRQCAEKLGHTPLPVEVIGSPFLASCFAGGWAHLLRAAELPPLPEHIGAVKGDRASEFKRQAQLYRRNKAEKLARKEARQKERRAAKEKWLSTGAAHKETPSQKRKAAEKARRLEADMAWGREHESDTDEQFLEYLRRCAGSLPEGQTLRKDQVQGGYYIAKRFGKWPVALFLAGLPLPGGCEPVSQEDLEVYERRRSAREGAEPDMKL